MKYIVYLSNEMSMRYFNTLKEAKKYINDKLLLGEATIYEELETIKVNKTLREYIKEHSIGAYHYFEFEIPMTNIKVRVMDVEEFKKYLKEDLLDKYIVYDVKNETHGSNCENYENIHHLTIKKKVE